MYYLLFFISIFELSINIANAQIPGQPANSYVNGSNWYCNSGYEKSGNSCVSIFAKLPNGQPANSYVNGSNWYCNSGYVKSVDSCVSIFANFPNGQPPNSYVNGSNWYCNSGYEKSGNSCVSIFNKANNSNQSENITSNTYSTLQKPYEQDTSKSIQTSETPMKKKVTKPKDMSKNVISGGLPPLKN